MDEKFRAELIDGILMYFDGKKSIQSLIVLADSYRGENEGLKDTVEEFMSMRDRIATEGGYTPDQLEDLFDTMLERLLPRAM